MNISQWNFRSSGDVKTTNHNPTRIPIITRHVSEGPTKLSLAYTFQVAPLDVFRAKGPTICLAKANGLGDTLKARQFDNRTGFQP